MNHLLDQGHVFPPEIATRLSERLQATAREHDVHIYAVTLPTLQVMPSRIKEKLDTLGTAATENWLKDQIGAVIVFDDEAGWVTIGFSDRTEREFSTVTLNALLKDPLIGMRKIRESPKKLEAAAVLLAQVLSDLKDEAVRANRRRAIVQNISIGILLILAGLAALTSFRKHPKRTPKSDSISEFE